MAVESRWVAVGEPAFAVLADTVAAARSDDPLAAVTVVTPTPAAAVSLRRGLARREPMAMVGFQAIEALAEQIAARRLGLAGGFGAGVDHELAVAAVRVELTRDPGRFAAIAHHRSTWEEVARAVTEVAALDADRRAAVAASGALPAAVVRLHDAVAEHAVAGGRAAVLRAATEVVRSEPATLDSFGTVIVHLPGRLDGPSTALLREIGRVAPVVLIGGLTGVAAADRTVVESIGRAGGSPPDHARIPAPAAPDRVVSANDVDDEVRAAVRSLLAEAEAGRPLHRMALVHPAGPPYARVVAEVLRAAGVPYAGPAVESLGHSTAGRVVLGLLEVATHDFSRQALVDLWSCGVVVGEDAAPLPSVALDERTRRLGIVDGRDHWHERIAGRRRWLDEHPLEPTGDPETDSRRSERRGREQAELDDVDAALTTTADLLDALPAAWDELGPWVATVLDTLCGSRARRTDWPVHELEADTAIRTACGRLASLAAIEPRPAPGIVVETVTAALDAPAPRRSTTGTGLQVTTLDHPPVVPLAAVAVVGMAEGHLPRLGRDDVLLADAVRAAAGLPVTDDLTHDQHRALLTALAASSGLRLLTYARGDQRSGRTQVPSRWLVDAIEACAGERPRSEALIAGSPVPGVDVVASHHASVARARVATTPLHDGERRLAALAAAPDFDAHPAALDPVIALGATLVRHRAADAFTRFDGNLHGRGVDVLGDGDRHLSPTSMETYATCPRRWFLRQALGVEETDRPEEVDRLQPRDKGSLAHRILERFVGDAIADGSVPGPDQPWGPEGDRRLIAVAEEEFADFERSGLTGHPRWWAYDRAEIVHVLRRTLRDDDQVRAASQATPSAVELTFGRGGVEPLRVTLGDGRVVPLAGQADRVDDVPGGVRVYDYKYASAGPYQAIRTPLEDGGDPVAGGTRLQLLAYAEAAATQRGVDRTSAWYWFLKPGHTGTHIGYEIGPEHRQLFRETLRVLVDGVGEGLFPARSGPHDWWVGTHVNCGFCEFDRICPADRDDEWERVRADPALRDVVRLAEEGAPAFLVTAPTADEVP